MRTERAGEFERIRAILAALPPGEGVIVPAGDDAAVLRPRAGHDLVVTTDAFVEGRHWRPDLLPPRAAGRRLAAANLSDMAAMGATPRWAVIAAAQPRRGDPAAARVLELACARALAAEGAAVVGGNLSATDGPAWWCVTLLGEVRRGRALRRAGARPGDVLCVTGFPGRAAAALACALAGLPAPRALAATYASPRSRVGVARALAGTGGVRAAIDVSDGLTGDLAHLCAAGGAGATLEAAAFPRDALLDAAARAVARARRRDATPAHVAALAERWRFGPSDDYELLLAIAPRRLRDCERAAAAAGAPLTSIGRVTDEPGRLRLRRPDGAEAPLPGRGHDHFG